MSSITPSAILRATRLRCSITPSAAISSHQTLANNSNSNGLRSFSGGFQGPTSRGMGRDGGGRGPGGKHRAPRKGVEGSTTSAGWVLLIDCTHHHDDCTCDVVDVFKFVFLNWTNRLIFILFCKHLIQSLYIHLSTSQQTKEAQKTKAEEDSPPSKHVGMPILKKI